MADLAFNIASINGRHRRQGYDWEVVPVETNPPFADGLFRPLAFTPTPRCDPDLPPLELDGAISHGRDAAFNIRMANDDLAYALGPADVRRRGNVLICEWRASRASVRLTAWPPELQTPSPMPDKAYRRDPRLVTACHLALNTGFRPQPSAIESRWIASFQPVARLPAQDLGLHRSRQYHLEFLRDLPCDDAIRGVIGHSSDAGALIFGDEEVYVMPLTRVIRFAVQRLLPAKGGGGSALRIELRTDQATLPIKDVRLASAPGADDLNDLVARLATSFGKSFALDPYEYDV